MVRLCTGVGGYNDSGLLRAGSSIKQLRTQSSSQPLITPTEPVFGRDASITLLKSTEHSLSMLRLLPSVHNQQPRAQTRGYMVAALLLVEDERVSRPH